MYQSDLYFSAFILALIVLVSSKYWLMMCSWFCIMVIVLSVECPTNLCRTFFYICTGSAIYFHRLGRAAWDKAYNISQRMKTFPFFLLAYVRPITTVCPFSISAHHSPCRVLGGAVRAQLSDWFTH